MRRRAAGVARDHEVDHLADRVGAQEPGHEHVGIGFVQLPGPDCLGPDCEAAAAVRVQEGREHRWRVEGVPVVLAKDPTDMHLSCVDVETGIAR
jgi:hypothetical protein